MRVQRFLVMAALALLTAVAGAQTPPQGEKVHKATDGVAQLVEIKATVEAIDYNTREVKLRTGDGKLLPLTVGPGVQRLSEVKVGDEVEIQYYASLSLSLTADGGAPSVGTMSTEKRNEKHELPGGVAAREIAISAKVTAIDKQTSSVTLVGPKGEPVSLEVDPSILGRLTVGDTVNAVYTEALAVSVSRASPASPE